MTKSYPHTKQLLSAKALFFATAMCAVGWSRFQNNFYLDNGLSSAEIGTLKSVGLLLKIAGEPFWSIVADLTDHKLVFGLCMVMQILTMEILRVSRPLTYNLIFFVKVLRTTTAPSSTLTTTASFKLTEGTNEGYGQQRMFGSLAWGCGAFIVGYLIDTYGMNSLFYYTYIFNAVSIAVVFGLPSANNAYPARHTKSDEDKTLIDEEHALLPKGVTLDTVMNRLQSRSNDNLVENANSNPNSNLNINQNKSMNQTILNPKKSIRRYAEELMLYLSNAPCRAILLNSFLYGIVMTVPDTFLFVSLDTDFQASRTFSGLMTSTSILACLPLFWYSGPLIARHGHFNLLFYSELTCLLRLVAYTLLTPAWSWSLYVLPFIQLLHGFNFAVYWSVSTDAIYKLAPKELTTICIAALNVSYFTFGGAVGNILFGHIYDANQGPGSVYWYSFLLLSAILMLFKTQEEAITSALLTARNGCDVKEDF